MPIYEFECQGCGHAFETLVRGYTASGVVCPACSGKKVVKQFSTFGMRGAGGGVGGETGSAGSSCAGCSAASCAGCTTK